MFQQTLHIEILGKHAWECLLNWVCKKQPPFPSGNWFLWITPAWDNRLLIVLYKETQNGSCCTVAGWLILISGMLHHSPFVNTSVFINHLHGFPFSCRVPHLTAFLNLNMIFISEFSGLLGRNRSLLKYDAQQTAFFANLSVGELQHEPAMGKSQAAQKA